MNTVKTGDAARTAVLAVVALFLLSDHPSAQGRGVLTLEEPGSAIGVTVRETTTADATAARMEQPAGVVVESVRTSSPAEKAGFRSGDLVLEFDGERVRSVRHFTRLVRETAPQQTVSAVVVRGTARQTLQVAPEPGRDFRADALETFRLGRDRLRDFDFNVVPQLRRGRLFGGPSLGVTLTPLSDQLAEYFGVKEGALVTSVESGSPAAAAGITAGDVITSIAGRSVRTAADVSEELRRARPGDGLDIGVTRNRKGLTLKATLPAARPVTPSGRGGLPV